MGRPKRLTQRGVVSYEELLSTMKHLMWAYRRHRQNYPYWQPSLDLRDAYMACETLVKKLGELEQPSAPPKEIEDDDDTFEPEHAR